MRHSQAWAAVLALAAALGGCRSGGSLEGANQAYQKGDYAGAWAQARPVADAGSSARAQQAAYLAGVSAHRLGRLADAERYLLAASRSSDPLLAGDALADLGLVHAQQGRYAQAVEAFNAAAAKTTGQAKANALFHAGLSQQKLGQWAAARNSFALARAASNDPSFRQTVSEHMATTGYTIQVGAYAQRDNAMKAAHGVAARAAALKMGSPRVVTGADAQGRALHLVQVGQFSSFEAASAMRGKLGDGAIVAPLKP